MKTLKGMTAFLCVAAAGIFVSCDKDDDSYNNGESGETIPSELRVFEGVTDGLCKEYYVYKLKMQEAGKDTLGYEVRKFNSNCGDRQNSSWDFDYLANHKFNFESESGDPLKSADYLNLVMSKIAFPTILPDQIYNIQYNPEGKIVHVGEEKVEDIWESSVNYSYNAEGRLDTVVYDYYGKFTESKLSLYRKIISYEWVDGNLAAININTHFVSPEGEAYGLPSYQKLWMTYEDASNLYTGDKSGQKAEILYPNVLPVIARYLYDVELIPHVSYEDLFAGKYGDGFLTDKVLTVVEYKDFVTTYTDNYGGWEFAYGGITGSRKNFTTKISFTSDGRLKAYDIVKDWNNNRQVRFELKY